MKKFLALLAVFVLGWFAHDAVRVAWAASSNTGTVSVKVPAISLAKPVPARPLPKTVAPNVAKPAPGTQGGETDLDRSLRNVGTSVANNGLWRTQPVSVYDESHPGSAFASPFHGQPRDL